MKEELNGRCEVRIKNNKKSKSIKLEVESIEEYRKEKTECDLKSNIGKLIFDAKKKDDRKGKIRRRR